MRHNDVRWTWLSRCRPCHWNLTTDEIVAGWHFCGDFDSLLVGPGMDEYGACRCQIDRGIKRAWVGFEPLFSATDGWEVQIALDHAGKCFKRYRCNTNSAYKATYIWQHWQPIGSLSEAQVEISMCEEIDAADFEWGD